MQNRVLYRFTPYNHEIRGTDYNLQNLKKGGEELKNWLRGLLSKNKVGAQYYFVCVVLDLFSRRVLAYGISDTNDTTLVMETFLSAYSSRNCPSGLMFHSDRGAPYTSYVFRELLREHHLRQSFSKPGEPYDNAVCESFFHTLKKEAIYHYLYATPNDLRITLDSYVKFYNEERPHRALNMLTPKEKEAEFMIQQ